VVSVSCLEHIRESEQVQREVFRLLRPGGQAVYGVPVKNIFTKLLFRLIGYDDEAIHPRTPMEYWRRLVLAARSWKQVKFFRTGAVWQRGSIGQPDSERRVRCERSCEYRRAAFFPFWQWLLS
jgi:SAM-dependent methyltransferase